MSIKCFCFHHSSLGHSALKVKMESLVKNDCCLPVWLNIILKDTGFSPHCFTPLKIKTSIQKNNESLFHCDFNLGHQVSCVF